METFGICVFAMKIPAMTHPYMVILLMNCVFVVPISVALFKTFCVSERRSVKKVIFLGIAFLLEITGVGVTVAVWIVNKHSTELNDIWYPVVGVLCLSVAWLPEIQSLLLQPRNGTGMGQMSDRHGNLRKNAGDTYETISEERSNELAHISVDVTEESTDEPKIIALEKPTWKLIIYMSGLKIVFTFVFSFLLLWVAIFDSIDAAEVGERFRSGWTDWDDFETYYFIANSCSSLLGYIVGYIACTTCMQKGAYALPLFLATPLATVLYSAYYSCIGILHPGNTGNNCVLDGTTTNIVLLVAAVLCLVLAQFFSFGYLIYKSQPLVKQNEVQVTYNYTVN